MKAWREAGPRPVVVGLEILDRLHGRVFELANAVQHTSGQAFVMAFQAGGAHALDRALEAIAYAWTDDAYAGDRRVEKPGRGGPLRMEKTFTVVPRGVALVIGCNTFPTWNSWPGCSRRWSPATRSSSSRTPGRCSRSRSPCRPARRCCRRPASTPTSTLAAEDPADSWPRRSRRDRR